MAIVAGNVIDIAGAPARTTVIFTSVRDDVVNGFQLVKSGEIVELTDEDGDFEAELTAGAYYVDVNRVRHSTIAVPDTDAELDFADLITSEAAFSSTPAGASTPTARLIEMTESEAYQLTTITRDSNGTITSAAVVWPDGAVGTFTTLATSDDGDDIDSYQITHSLTGKVVTQPAVTRNAYGDVTVKPALTVE